MKDSFSEAGKLGPSISEAGFSGTSVPVTTMLGPSLSESGNPGSFSESGTVRAGNGKPPGYLDNTPYEEFIALQKRHNAIVQKCCSGGESEALRVEMHQLEALRREALERMLSQGAPLAYLKEGVQALDQDLEGRTAKANTNVKTAETSGKVRTSEDGFKVPRKNFKRPRDSESTSPIKVNNKFQVLESRGTDGNSTQANDTNAQTTDNTQIIDNMDTTEFTQAPTFRGRIPPIAIRKEFVKWVDLSKSLKDAGLSNFTGKTSGETVNIKVSTESTYRIATAMLDDMGIPYHSFKTGVEQTLKVVLRGVPADVGATVVQDELLELGFGVKSVFQYSHVIDGAKVKIPVYFVELENTPTNKNIYNMTDFIHLKIRVDTFKKSKQPTQCHRCQKFGHAQSGCTNPAVCVKCAGGHLTVDCPTKGRVESPKCANCGGDHTANYRGCPKRPVPKAEREHGQNTAEPNTHNQQNTRRQNRTREQVARDRTNEVRPEITPAPVRSGVSYATASTAGPSNSPQQHQANTRTQVETQVETEPQQHGETQDTTPQPENTPQAEENLFDYIRQCETFMKDFNLKQILTCIKTAAHKFKSAKTLMDKLEIGFAVIEELITMCNHE